MFIAICTYLMMGAAIGGLAVSYYRYRYDWLTDDEAFGWSLLFIFAWPLSSTAFLVYFLGKRLWEKEE